MEITIGDISEVFPRPLLDDEEGRATALIAQALELIDMEFARRGRDLESELASSRWLHLAVKQAVRVMVSQAVLVGENIGMSSASSTTGPQSDSVTFSQGIGIHWGGVGVDNGILELLGLLGGALPRGRGGVVIPFGERRPRLPGAEFSERRRR